MSLFLLLINYLTALVGVQLLRGDVQSGANGDGKFIIWGEIFNSFLGIYQVFSSENWTDVLYDAAQAEIPLRQSPIVILFIAGWMFFANCEYASLLLPLVSADINQISYCKCSSRLSTRTSMSRKSTREVDKPLISGQRNGLKRRVRHG